MANNPFGTGDWLPQPPSPAFPSGRNDQDRQPPRPQQRDAALPRPYARAQHWRPSYDRPAFSHHPERSVDTSRPSDRAQDRGNDRSRWHQETSRRGTSYSSRPGQAPLTDSSRVLPKHFAKPLTCFYWATQGHCSKSDESCWYAHEWTGVVAAAPVRIGDGGAVAGREAERAVNQMSDREAVLQARQTAIVERENQLARDQEAVAQESAGLKDMMQEIYGALNAIDESNVDAARALERRRAGLVDALTQSSAAYNPTQTIHEAVNAVDGAMDALATLKVKVSAIAHRLSNKAVNCTEVKHENSNDQTMAGTEEQGGVSCEENLP